MVNLIGFLSDLDTLNGTGQFYFLQRLATEPGYFTFLLSKHADEFIQLCTFPPEPTEELSVDMSKRLLNLATLVFHRLGINYCEAQFSRKPEMPLFTNNTQLVAPAFKLGMELVRSLSKAHFYLLAVSYYNFLRNRIENCSATYRELFTQCSRRVIPAFLEYYTNNEPTFTERYWKNDPHGILPGFTEPLGPETLQTLLNKEKKEGKAIRTLCLHGIQRSIPKSDAEAKPLCHLSGYPEFRDRRCK
jgi:hypothetical protein